MRLDELDLRPMTSGWGSAQKDKSVTQTPLGIAKVKFEHGVGTHACSELWLQLDGKAREFTAKVGVDDNAGDQRAAIEFFVYGDDRVLWHSGICKLGEAPRDCRVDLAAGVRTLTLVVANAADGIGYDHGDWAGATFDYDGVAPVSEPPKKEDAVILDASLVPPAQPEIHGPKVYAESGRGLHFSLPDSRARGSGPLRLSRPGCRTGWRSIRIRALFPAPLKRAGTFRAELTARNADGKGHAT